LIINYDTLASTEVDIDFQHAALGTVQTSDSETWASVAGAWTDDSQPWNASNRRKFVLSKPASTKFLQLDLGTTRDGSSYTGTIQRTSLGVVGRNRKTGEWIEDFEVRKVCHRIWPKISLTNGTVNIRLGGQDIPNGPVRWSAYQAFDPNTQKYCDITAEGAALAIEITGAVDWKLDGYKLDLVTLGRF
jgi:hypothetical protein